MNYEFNLLEINFDFDFHLIDSVFCFVLRGTRWKIRGESGGWKRITDEVPPGNHEIPRGAHHEEQGEKSGG